MLSLLFKVSCTALHALRKRSSNISRNLFLLYNSHFDTIFLITSQCGARYFNLSIYRSNCEVLGISFQANLPQDTTEYQPHILGIIYHTPKNLPSKTFHCYVMTPFCFHTLFYDDLGRSVRWGDVLIPYHFTYVTQIICHKPSEPCSGYPSYYFDSNQDICYFTGA